MILLGIYLGLLAAIWGATAVISRSIARREGWAARKTVTFGDASAVRASRVASVASVTVIFLIWAAFTGSDWTPVHAPADWQMRPIWLPPPETVWTRLMSLIADGFRNFTLWEHLAISVGRVFAGFFFGALIGIPLGFAMGLNSFLRGWFDPIVEFMRPVPPLALIPLVIIWYGIDEKAKVILLFLAALWIMAIAARSGVSGVKLSKVHAAYSLGASRVQVLRHVIMPNALPDIFTGARVAMGVCWGTVVAAELVAAEKGAGFMIMVASRFMQTDIVLMGIILIGVIGYSIDVAMRTAERWLVPWKGRG
ncbi:MAG: ABC transporter permease subunit [Alkalilacustris sp.]